MPQKYAHRKGKEGIGEKGGCLKKMHNAQKNISELILKRVPFSLKGQEVIPSGKATPQLLFEKQSAKTNTDKPNDSTWKVKCLSEHVQLNQLMN